MLNIVIPMAGAGSRFAREGYRDPKPLIPICGVPMIRLVIENLRPKRSHRFIFVCQQAHMQTYDLAAKLTAWSQTGPDARPATVLGIDGLTEGAACTVLKAKQLIDAAEPLMIANADQWIDCDINGYLRTMDEQDLDGLIMTMRASDPKWSYVGLGPDGHVSRVAEKRVISREATVGIYSYRHGSDFVRAAESMIAAQERVNQEFYVAPAYAHMISAGAKIGIYNVGAESDGMYGLGTPDDLRLFMGLPAHRQALEACL